MEKYNVNITAQVELSLLVEAQDNDAVYLTVMAEIAKKFAESNYCASFEIKSMAIEKQNEKE